MTIQAVKYIDYDANDIVRVGCMKCNKTLANRQWLVDGSGNRIEQRLIHMSHSRRLTVKMEDSSDADLIICDDCLQTITDADLPSLEKTMKWGWKRAWDWKFLESDKAANRQAYKRIKDFFKVGDEEVELPLRVWKLLFNNKGIVRRK